MAYIPHWYISHTRRVQILYKKYLRDIEDWTLDRAEKRIQQVLLRAEFDKNRDIKDPIKAKRALEAAETYYEYVRHAEPFKFPTSFGGTAWERDEMKFPHDGILDYWHPLEKAQYPDYFAKREQRKKEFVEWYDKKYGRPAAHEY
ncbi:NADH dehydrogenase [ubiquinone] 1 beta subcomplex subunit 9 [Planococcus citri]|uniref:NADH dehydrogenase [ubiquinone] 1 beta subcomplex subunit 9 n=1 Tax=Planococcus citri TaxID=170843 RepID=UPI0031F9CB1B